MLPTTSFTTCSNSSGWRGAGLKPCARASHDGGSNPWTPRKDLAAPPDWACGDAFQMKNKLSSHIQEGLVRGGGGGKGSKGRKRALRASKAALTGEGGVSQGFLCSSTADVFRAASQASPTDNRRSVGGSTEQDPQAGEGPHGVERFQVRRLMPSSLSWRW